MSSFVTSISASVVGFELLRQFVRSVGETLLSSDESNVFVDGDSGEVLGEDAASEGVDLALEDDLASGSLESEVESSDSAEEAADAEGTSTIGDIFAGGPFFASPPLISAGTASVRRTLFTPFATESMFRVMNAFGCCSSVTHGPPWSGKENAD